MKVGITISAYNRSEYLSKCLDSLRRCELPLDSYIVIVDDGSTEEEAKRLIWSSGYSAISKDNKGIKDSLLVGFKWLFDIGCDVVMNFDSDSIVSKTAVTEILRLKEKYPDRIVTGFHSTTKNADGTERHIILDEFTDAYEKKSVGGINMCMDKVIYDKYVKPALETKLGNWDHMASIAALNDGKPVISVKKSVIQHIGVISAMGHSSGGEPIDRADDFIYQPQGIIPTGQRGYYNPSENKLQLKNVTLICADGFDLNRVIHAANIACKNIEFGAVKILSNFPSDDPRTIKIRPLLDRKDYSQFVLKEMVNYVDTDYMIIFQYDGFPINAAAWSEEFLKYDMVGASWKFRPEKRTANGGFSLRSKIMMELIRDDDGIYLQNDNIINNWAEDHVLFYIYREYLEQKYDVKIAPEEICDKFSIEAYGVKPPGNKYNGSFGFHSTHVDFNDADLPYIPYKLPNREIQ